MVLRIPQDLKASLHVVGAASAEGVACLRYLLSRGYQDITVHEAGQQEEFLARFSASHVSLPKEEREHLAGEIMKSPARFAFGKDYLKGISKAEAIFVGQNWFNYSFNFPALPEARDRGVPLITLAQLYFGLSKAPIIGVTGTNGKTTTVNLLYHILKREKKVFLAGNDLFHPQVLHKLHELTPEDFLLLEISNRQLISLDQSPHMAIITNLEEDHLEEHGGWEGYLAAKKRIFQFQTSRDYSILNGNHRIINTFENLPGQVIRYGREDSTFQIVSNCLVYYNGSTLRPLLYLGDIPLKGDHNRENILAAASGAFAAGLSLEAIQQGIETFPGVKNRLELIRSFQGVEFYNDLASTSPAATLAALKALEGRIFLIAGGEEKGAHYRELAREISQRDIVPLLIKGGVAQRLREHLSTPGEVFSDLPTAVNFAWERAREGDKILLSPGGAHFYTQHIQNQLGFIRLVKKLKRLRTR